MKHNANKRKTDNKEVNIVVIETRETTRSKSTESMENKTKINMQYRNIPKWMESRERESQHTNERTNNTGKHKQKKITKKYETTTVELRND